MNTGEKVVLLQSERKWLMAKQEAIEQLKSDGFTSIEVEYEENVWPAKDVRIDQITGN